MRIARRIFIVEIVIELAQLLLLFFRQRQECLQILQQPRIVRRIAPGFLQQLAVSLLFVVAVGQCH